MKSTRVTRHFNAPRAAVYRALLDQKAVARWMVPGGKTTPQTDTYHGRFVKLVPNEKVVERISLPGCRPI